MMELAFCSPLPLSCPLHIFLSPRLPNNWCKFYLAPVRHSRRSKLLQLHPCLCLESSGIPSRNIVAEPGHDQRHSQQQQLNENNHVSDDRGAIAGDSNSDGDQTLAPSVVKRSKMLLTRRIFAWTLRRRISRSRASARPAAEEPVDSTASTTSNPPPVMTVLGQPIAPNQLPVETLLSSDGPVSTFVFHRGHSPFTLRRRHGDPPFRYLKLSYILAEPLSPQCAYCSNPRVSGTLKHWYQVASRWNVLGKDFRKPLVLGDARRVTIENGRLHRPRTRLTSYSKQNSENGVSSSSGTRRPNSNKEDPRLSLLLRNTRWDRALGRSPRVIVIGDVHGCIDEFQSLLRLADYQPGDQVVLLGDMVAKGPDSVAVVQLAREIGARGVRGNHDFEVVRWWEAYCRGDSDVVVSIEHARIAQSLGEKEHMWLMECPWFIECTEMAHLFVHAGFIPGVKLTQQNPRLMMNMRSVLIDGTVTAKNVDHCEWAKLWRGPQTVVFGHDAYRGLQLHEYAKGIDTGCVYGGRLTALLLPENRLISVPSKRAYIERKRFRTAPLFQ